MALDVGTKRIGLAVSDSFGITVRGLETLNRRDKLRDINDLEGVIRKFQVDEIVVGHPVRMDGSSSTQTDRVLKFVELMKKRFQLPIHLWDERLTSVEAEGLIKQENKKLKRSEGIVDRLAAEIILRTYLDHRFKE